MATPPTCKVCGTAHWSSQPHAGSKAVKEKVAAPVPVQVGKREMTLKEYLAERRAKQAAYMRDYRKRQRTSE